jgi:two-component system, OmpR family, phosphate regulon sensor histidine kinase PhoR
MKERKYSSSVWLMVISMVLLLTLQVLWLRAEYRSAVDSFNRETNLLFRSTVHQLSDSLFFSAFRFTSENEDTGSGRAVADNDTTMQPTRVISLRMAEPDSINAGHQVPGDTIRQSTDIRSMFGAFTERFNEDSLAHIFAVTLADQHKHIPFTILRKEMNRNFRRERLRHEPIDTIPFTTSFVPFGWTAYAASFDRVQPFLLKRILPQIGFSLFITVVILFSFVLVHRSLRAQQRLLEQKNDFIGNMTHELKTPVATVGVALEAMRNFNVLKNTEKARLYIDMATQELNRLSLMTDKIIRTSVYDYASDIRQNKVLVDMKPLIGKVVSSFSLVAEKCKTSMVFTCEGETTLMGHEEHLTQMVYNLVDNAFKYAADGPEIAIHMEGDEHDLIIRVSDKGPGIPEPHAAKVFDKFYRVPSGDVHNVKGYGMGLHYVKGVAAGHGGRITLDSRPGEGASFRIKLPRQII